MQQLRQYRQFWFVIILGAIALWLQFVNHQAMWAQVLITGLGLLLAIIMFIEMVRTLRSGKFGVDLLAITAVLATLAVGEYWAALIVLLMLTGGDALEDFAASRANSELQELLNNSPQTAHRLVGDRLSDVAVSLVAVGDRLLVKPGEVMPVDGTLTTGPTTVNEASLTGEADRLRNRSVTPSCPEASTVRHRSTYKPTRLPTTVSTRTLSAWSNRPRPSRPNLCGWPIGMRCRLPCWPTSSLG